MADKSRLFNPPQDSLPSSNDPAIVRVPLDKLDWANRPSQQKSWGNDWASVKNLSNNK